MTGTINTIIVIGASHAGVQAVDTLRREGGGGKIVLIGAEAALPYQRPPLSKKFLSGELPLERIPLRAATYYEQNNIDLRLNTRATQINRAERMLTLSDGTVLAYDKLILCTGSHARELACPGNHLRDVHYLRTANDVEAIRPKLIAGKHLVVVGAGYIGLETAATARKMGLNVTVLEMAERCLNRVTSPIVSEFFARRHAQEGVSIRVNARVEAILGDTHVTGVRCDDGTELPADIVIAGIGILPEIELARVAGIECNNGIVVDTHCRTNDANIYAAGDCTFHPSVRFGRSVRLESVDNAVEQARVAAAHICGKDIQHAHTPWFWSDQYDVKLQTAGLCQGFDRIIVRGDVAQNQFSVWYLHDDELLAVDAINKPGDFILGKRWIGERKRPDAALLADVAVDLKTIA